MLHEMDRRKDVDVEKLLERFFRELLDARQRNRAERRGVVDQEIESPEVARRGDQSVSVMLVGHVACNRNDLTVPLELAASRFEGTDVAPVDNHPEAVREERSREFFSESARTARDDRHVARFIPSRHTGASIQPKVYLRSRWTC